MYICVCVYVCMYVCVCVCMLRIDKHVCMRQLPFLLVQMRPALQIQYCPCVFFEG